MTIEEAVAQYGTLKYTTSSGDTLLSVVDAVYNDRQDIYFQVLIKLNNRYDWSALTPNQVIYYLPKSSIPHLYEIVNR